MPSGARRRVVRLGPVPERREVTCWAMILLAVLWLEGLAARCWVP